MMSRQRALDEWILGNGNLWAWQGSLIVGHLRRPLFRPIQDRVRNTWRFGKIGCQQAGKLRSVPLRSPACGGINIRDKILSLKVKNS